MNLESYPLNLLKNAWAQWQAGEWESLAKLDPEAIEQEEGSAELALLAGAALFQLGKISEAKAQIARARTWGAGERVVGRVLLAGVHNSLGRAHTAINQDELALGHFENSVRPFTAEEERELMAEARAVSQATQLGLLTQAVNMVSACTHKKGLAENQAKIIAIEIDLLREKIAQIQRKQAEGSYAERISMQKTPSTQVEVKQDSNIKQYFGLNKLDKKLEIYLNYDSGYFIEIGANDGLDQSNTAYFEKNRNWRGILIEPILHNYLACKKNRSNRNHFFCSACVSFDYKHEYVKLHYANLMTATSGVESDVDDPKAHANSGKIYNQCDHESTEILVQARTMQSILDEAKAPKRIDLLSLDVEGAELDVLKGINHEAYRFNFILVECRDIEKMESYLMSKNYFKVEKLSVHDYLFEDGSRLGNKAA